MKINIWTLSCKYGKYQYLEPQHSILMQINQRRQFTSQKSEILSKVDLSPYDSVQMSELNVTLMVFNDFKEPLNIVTDSQCAKRVVLHIETVIQN